MQAQKCQQNSYLCEQTLERTVGRFAFRVVAEVESRLLRFPYVEKCLGVGETFTCPAGVRWQRRAVTGSQNMQIALHTMQTGECCSLHRTGQTRQPEKITSKDVALLFFVCRSENEMRQASELSRRQKTFLSFGWISSFRFRLGSFAHFLSLKSFSPSMRAFRSP